MTDGVETAAPSGERSAGALIREARQAQGLHIAALAAAIKVTQRKLEALENDRYDELPDTTFTRALAQAVCRALKIDAEPVLARLPQAPGKGLDQVTGGLNAPFRERGIRRDPGEWPGLNRPVIWGSLALLLAAAGLYLLPAGSIGSYFARKPAAVEAPASAPASAAVATVAPASAAPLDVPAAPSAQMAAASAPPVLAAAEPASSPAPAASAPLALAPGQAAVDVQATTAASWVEVQDATGKVLVSRTLAAGEALSLAGTPPMRVKIGNGLATQLRFRGQPVALPPRATIVRMELK